MSQFTARRLSREARGWMISGLLVAAAVVLPHGAQGATPITSVYAGPITAASTCDPTGASAVASTQAGSRSDFCVAFALNSPAPPGDALQRMVVDTPLGFAGDPTGRPICSVAQFAQTTTADATCDPASQVGAASVDLRLQVVPPNSLGLSGVAGRAYNLAPGPDEVARIGLVLDPPGNIPQVKIPISVGLRPAPDVGLRSTINDIPRQICLVTPQPRCDYAIALDEFSLRFWGSNIDHPTMPAPFALLGADCTSDQVTVLRASSYDGVPTEGEDRYQLTDCATAPFAPGIALTTVEQRPDVTTAATVTATFGAGSGGRVAASPKRVAVTLPDGLMLSAQIASGPSGLPTCSAAAFAVTSNAAAACPAGAGVGEVRITSPVLSAPLTGTAYVGAQREVGALPDLYVEAQLGGDTNAPRVKLVGQLSVGADGRLLAVLDDLPQVPVSEFALTFRGGDHSALVTPSTCRAGSATMVATPRGGAEPTTLAAPYVIDQDCAAVGGFAPSVTFGSADPQAGGASAFTTLIARPDRSQRLARTVIDLPPGQVANLKGVPECAQDVAARGACPAATRVGSVVALAGVGPAPYRITGDVFLTARADGAVAGISIHVPVILGGVDLGSLDVPARIEIRPEDLGLRIRADVPERFRGLPLDLRQLEVVLDRQGFPLNPTSCGVLQSTSQLTGTSGGTDSVAAGYQMRGCDRLAFAPTMEASLSGETAYKGHPKLSVRIGSAAGSAALRRVAVTLPVGLGVDLAQVPRACPQDTFRAGGCPQTAKIGTATGTLSIADEGLAGSIYLLKPGAGTVLPGLGLDFTGRFAGRVVGTNAVDPKTGQIVSRFDTIPDLSLTSLQIDIAGGSGGLVLAAEGLCSRTLSFAARLDGQNGASAQRTAGNVCNAPLGTRLTRFTGRLSGLRQGRPVLRLRGVGDADRLISRVELTLPAGWSLASQRGRAGSRYAKVSGLSIKGTATASRRSARRLRVTLPTRGSSKFLLVTRTRTIAVRSSKARRVKTPVVITARITYRDRTALTVPVLLTPR